MSISAGAFAVLGVAFEGNPDDASSLDVHDQIIRGLPTRTLFAMQACLRNLPIESALGPAIGISERTFQRWKKHPPNQRLSPEVSGRLWKFAEILGRATEVFGTRDEAERWLQLPAMALDRRRPIDLLSSPAGVEMVEDLLTRLKYDVYT